jgi:hypothetical protein
MAWLEAASRWIRARFCSTSSVASLQEQARGTLALQLHSSPFGMVLALFRNRSPRRLRIFRHELDHDPPRREFLQLPISAALFVPAATFCYHRYTWFALPKARLVVACRTSSTGVCSSLRSPAPSIQTTNPLLNSRVWFHAFFRPSASTFELNEVQHADRRT